MYIAQLNQVKIHQHFYITQQFDCHIDALFGIGLNRDLDQTWQNIIQLFNTQSGLKIAVDIPSIVSRGLDECASWRRLV